VGPISHSYGFRGLPHGVSSRNIIDLMAALKASVEGGNVGAKKAANDADAKPKSRTVPKPELTSKKPARRTSAGGKAA
jgi:hypothetical protein